LLIISEWSFLLFMEWWIVELNGVVNWIMCKCVVHMLNFCFSHVESTCMFELGDDRWIRTRVMNLIGITYYKSKAFQRLNKGKGYQIDSGNRPKYLKNPLNLNLLFSGVRLSTRSSTQRPKLQDDWRSALPSDVQALGNLCMVGKGLTLYGWVMTPCV